MRRLFFLDDLELWTNTLFTISRRRGVALGRRLRPPGNKWASNSAIASHRPHLLRFSVVAMLPDQRTIIGWRLLPPVGSLSGSILPTGRA
jgi:hypothetical protein